MIVRRATYQERHLHHLRSLQKSRSLIEGTRQSLICGMVLLLQTYGNLQQHYVVRLVTARRILFL